MLKGGGYKLNINTASSCTGNLPLWPPLLLVGFPFLLTPPPLLVTFASPSLHPSVAQTKSGGDKGRWWWWICWLSSSPQRFTSKFLRSRATLPPPPFCLCSSPCSSLTFIRSYFHPVNNIQRQTQCIQRGLGAKCRCVTTHNSWAGSETVKHKHGSHGFVTQMYIQRGK